MNLRMKWIPALTALSAMAAFAGPGSGTGTHGGDACDKRIDDIRRDVRDWIENGGSAALDFSATGHARTEYDAKMLSILADHAVVLSCLKPTSANPTPITVGGKPKTCRSYVSRADRKPHIECDFDRFYGKVDAQGRVTGGTSRSDQYWLIHHEFAGLQGLETNAGASSDYSISRQIVGFLETVTDLRLVVRKPAPPARKPLAYDCPSPAGDALGLFDLIADPKRTTAEVLAYLDGHLVARDVQNEFCDTQLFAAVRANKLDLLKALYDRFGRPDVNSLRNDRGKSLFEFSCERTDLSIPDFLEKLGANVSLNSELEAMAGHASLGDILELLRRGAKPVASDALANAAHGNSAEVMEAILRADSQPRVERAFFFAVCSRPLDVRRKLQTLLTAGAKVEPEDASPLVLAADCASPSEEAVRFLIENGASVNRAILGEGSPLSVAAGTDSVAIVRLLIAAGADVNADVLLQEGWDQVESDGYEHFYPSVHTTPLRQAAKAGSAEVIALLLSSGARCTLGLELEDAKKAGRPAEVLRLFESCR